MPDWERLASSHMAAASITWSRSADDPGSAAQARSDRAVLQQQPATAHARPICRQAAVTIVSDAFGTKSVRETFWDRAGRGRHQGKGLARLDRDCAKDLAREGDRLVVMSTRPAAFDVRENIPGNVEMAVSLDFLHFHQNGWK